MSNPEVAEGALGFLSAHGVGETEVRVPNHSPDPFDAPVDERLDHHVARGAHVRVFCGERDVDPVIPNIDWEGLDAIVEAAWRLAGQWMEVPAVPRAAQPAVLDRALAERSESAGVSELARRTGLPKSTTSRILTSLEELGMVEVGEERQTVLPLPALPRRLPQGWPYNVTDRILEGLGQITREKEEETISRVNGKDAVSLQVVHDAQANIIELSHKVQDQLDILNRASQITSLLQGGVPDNVSYQVDGSLTVDMNEVAAFTPADYIAGTDVVLVFRFKSDGGWSDEDCQWPTGNAFVLDDFQVTSDNGVSTGGVVSSSSGSTPLRSAAPVPSPPSERNSSNENWAAISGVQ